MPTRRDFVKQAAILSGAAGMWGGWRECIEHALAIDPKPGSSFLDAEHVVILMQENRSFDHSYGTLRGVRGFNDPRAITLADGSPVWMQANAAGERHLPFRFNIADTSATWMGSLPHSWADQVDARNQGRYDRWLHVKQSGERRYAAMPLTMGYYNRQDIPFYYALADAFTICDQNFCSSLTGTTANRLYLWTGTIREKQAADSPANLLNSDVDYDTAASWTTFPERLEDLGISWKIYQNELSLEMGFEGDEDAWLANFGDNPIEYFTQFNVRFSPAHRAHVLARVTTLPGEIETLKRQVEANTASRDELTKLKKELAEKVALLKRFGEEIQRYSQENWEKLSARQKSLHQMAFSTNVGDPNYRRLTELTYRDGAVERRMEAPKGDVLHQFRQDVEGGKLPAVSWLVAPQKFSDHPDSPWYGAWYISEALAILTHNPDVWRKTVFILCYDENDGYFDHVPPFVAPHPRLPYRGRVSKGIDASVEYVELEQDMKRKPRHEARDSSIGLGYRVPLLIASPWSRGGCVCSQVFDHTSILQLLEKLLSHKTGRPVAEPNISQWRRAVCGDLTSAFQPYEGGEIKEPAFLSRDAFVEGIHKAQFKNLPSGYKALSPEEVAQVRQDPRASPLMPRQEPGVRQACALPYQLEVDGRLSEDRGRFEVHFAARNDRFGPRSAGSPFVAYARMGGDRLAARNYAVAAGDRLEDTWSLGNFNGGNYHLQIYGPNGFFREFQGNREDPTVDVHLDDAGSTGNERKFGENVLVKIVNRGSGQIAVIVHDNAYKQGDVKKEVPVGGEASLSIDTRRSFGWYDFTVRIAGNDQFAKRYAGHVETGSPSMTDPAMGGAVT